MKPEHTADLEARFTALAKEKARLDLVNRLLVGLSAVAGLDNLLEHILRLLMETIGAKNVIIYYHLDADWHCRDIYGTVRQMAEPDHPEVATALATGEPLRLPGEQESYPSATATVATQTWIFPLLANERQVGAACMEGMQLTDEGIFQSLLPFFVYAGLMLDNEINNFSRLADAHRKLQDSETIYRALFEQSPDGIQLVDPADAKPVYFNTAIHKLLGYTREEYTCLAVSDYEQLDDAREIEARFAALRTTGSTTLESVFRTKQGDLLDVYVSLRTLTISGRELVLAIVRDITERKRAEEERLNLERQLLHSQKLESLGVLAGGIAHDFNNILTAIIGNTDLALMRLSPDSPVLENLQRIEKAAARAADLAKQMLAYSGKGRFVVEAIDLNQLVEEMGQMLDVSISKKAILHYSLTRPLPAVKVDATQIRQIIMNLVINASEAIGEHEGDITLVTGVMNCNETDLSECWLTDPIPEGAYVFLEVSDTGCGMSKETLGRLFDPFFTTKFTGRGLGMAAVLGIVRGHKGAIRVDSEPGQGSRFRIFLPADLPLPEPAKEVDDPGTWKGSGGVVLLVDDEETVLAIGSEMLDVLGFNVLTAVDGREALEIYGSRNDIDVVILDLVMPHMDGEQCFMELRAIDPQIQVIISSGFSEYEVSRKFAGKGVAGFIQKPYKMSSLKDALQTIKGPDACRYSEK